MEQEISFDAQEETFGPKQTTLPLSQIVREDLSESEYDSEESESDEEPFREITEGGKVLKVQYKNYQSKILKQGLKTLMHRTLYKDVTCHCDGGSIDSNRLLLASMSPFLESLLADVPTLDCLLYTSPSPRDRQKSRMPSSA